MKHDKRLFKTRSFLFLIFPMHPFSKKCWYFHLFTLEHKKNICQQKLLNSYRNLEHVFTILCQVHCNFSWAFNSMNFIALNYDRNSISHFVISDFLSPWETSDLHKWGISCSVSPSWKCKLYTGCTTLNGENTQNNC